MTLKMPQSWNGNNDLVAFYKQLDASQKTVRLAVHTVSNLPLATQSGEGALVFVSNESGGAVVAFSDGAVWRRVTDRAVVS